MSNGAIVSSNKKTGMNREAGTTKTRVVDNQRDQRNKRDRELYKKSQEVWKDNRKLIDEMNQEELHEFVKDGYKENILDDDRVGMLTMKVNPWEYAVISLTRNIMGYKSMRQAIIKLCLSRIDVWTGKAKQIKS